MKASDTLWEFHKAFEGVRYRAYYDSVGKLTIGVGHANQDIEPFDEDSEWDDDKCYDVWQRDLTRAEELANGWLRREVPQPFFDMLVDLIYNTGRQPRTYMQDLNAGDYEAAVHQLLRWVYAQGHVLLGLVKRRFAGFAMCLGDNWYEIAQCPLSKDNLEDFNRLISRYGYAVEPDEMSGYVIVEV